jgi:hypothetical protein
MAKPTAMMSTTRVDEDGNVCKDNWQPNFGSVSEDQIWLDGKAAADRGDDASENPYDEGTYGALTWYDGFISSDD